LILKTHSDIVSPVEYVTSKEQHSQMTQL